MLDCKELEHLFEQVPNFIDQLPGGTKDIIIFYDHTIPKPTVTHTTTIDVKCQPFKLGNNHLNQYSDNKSLYALIKSEIPIISFSTEAYVEVK